MEDVSGLGIDRSSVAQGHSSVDTKRSDDHQSELLTSRERSVVSRSEEVVVVITDDTATLVTTAGT